MSHCHIPPLIQYILFIYIPIKREREGKTPLDIAGSVFALCLSTECCHVPEYQSLSEVSCLHISLWYCIPALSSLRRIKKSLSPFITESLWGAVWLRGGLAPLLLNHQSAVSIRCMPVWPDTSLPLVTCNMQSTTSSGCHYAVMHDDWEACGQQKTAIKQHKGQVLLAFKHFL